MRQISDGMNLPIQADVDNLDIPYLRIVLFTSDRAEHFRPNKDESQWFNRRDALVRCVASFLYGPARVSSEAELSRLYEQRELVIIFDQGWTRIHLKLIATSSTTFPTEGFVLSVMKQASDTPGKTLIKDGLSCCLVKSRTAANVQLPSRMDNKRDILEFLQSTCDMNFLRQHRLNSSTAVVLKKTNKQALLKVWEKWLSSQKGTKTTASPSDEEMISEILRELLQPATTDIQRVYAGTLHESSELELPYWKTSQASHDHNGTQICLFLGAVRDMSESENYLLQRICQELSIPCTGIRIGPVAEFTSKILTIVAFHHAHGRLASAVEELARGKYQGGTNHRISSLPAHCLDVIYFAPIPSSEMVLEMPKRSSSIWQLVRCTVVTLWRSRLAGGGKSLGDQLVNRLTIAFEDGVYVALSARDVFKMAEAHEAAPCEYQVINLILRRLRESSATDLSVVDSKSFRRRAKKILQDSLDGRTAQQTAVIFLQNKYGDKGEGPTLADLCYNAPKAKSVEEPALEGSGSRLIAVLSPSSGEECGRIWDRAMLRAFRKLGMHPFKYTFCSPSHMDEPAALITLLQHLCYQRQMRAIFQPGVGRKRQRVEQSSQDYP